jgi:hypothetical protein
MERDGRGAEMQPVTTGRRGEGTSHARYVVAQRRGGRHPWMAFIPLFGLWIVVAESVGRSGWLALLELVPSIGILIVSISMAIAVPKGHGRSRRWTAALIVPVLNFLGYWAYALTLARPTQPVLQHAGV